jgi:diaminohydroxyphosphoribosylaminopyrimidine deaminase / 5-amino-6-(5-phosphoribosylamino)uracil reductase
MSTWFSAADHQHMQLALNLAAQGLYTTKPNPRVGCVIAKGDHICGKGAHLYAGQPHAEVYALEAAGGEARGATAYVTLEPCAHFGRTPPCADALIAAGIARVVVATGDPFGKVAGKGLARLREAGVRVDVGLLEAAARELNRSFFARVERQRPWLTLKIAASLDGRTALANGNSRWITGEAARADVQLGRAESCAVLTSASTVLADDAELSARVTAPCVQPLKVVLDSSLRTPPNARLFANARQVLIYHHLGASAERAAALRAAGAELIATSNDALAASANGPSLPGTSTLRLSEVLRDLATKQVNQVWTECGPALSGALLASGLVDELRVYVAPKLLGIGARPLATLPQLEQLPENQWQFTATRMLSSDLCLELRHLPSI